MMVTVLASGGCPAGLLLIRDEVVALDAAPEKVNGQRGAEYRNLN
jgi:hypothetical protein